MSELPVDPLAENDIYPGERDFTAVPDADSDSADGQSFRVLPWRSYLRCTFLFAIFAAVGFTAWRPAMLRFSVMMSAVSPSRGDSLAWQVLPDPVPPPTPRKRLPSPDEWRLASDHQNNWQAARTTSGHVFSYQGGPLPKRPWTRDSTNPWAWEDDGEFGRKRIFDPEFQPNQKPATSFRADDTAGWGNVVSIPSPRDAARPDDRNAVARTVPSPTLLPGVGDTGTPSVTAATADQAVQDVFSALQIPSLSPRPAGEVPLPTPGAVQPDRADQSATAGPGASGSVAPVIRSESQAAAGVAGLSGDGGASLFGTSDNQSAIRTAPFVSPPLSLQGSDGVFAPAAGVTDGQDRVTGDAVIAETSPTSHAQTATAATPDSTTGDSAAGSLRPSGSMTTGTAATSQAGGGESGTGAPGSLSGGVNVSDMTGGADWKNQEITGAIESAYLTVYPKLKFIGLCVPGQDYVRKYNQVAVPMDLVERKLSARDGRTPYGKYYIAGRERGSDGAARLVLSWPSPDDARRIGLDPESTQAVENAWIDKILPPQTTAAGGGVAIEEAGPGQEWTSGGLGLEKPQMEELFLALPDGAWVFIQE